MLISAMGQTSFKEDRIISATGHERRV